MGDLPDEVLVLDRHTVHRAWIAAVLLSAKVHDEQYGDNLFYAKIAKLPCNTINCLELELLGYLGWSIGLCPTAFAVAAHALQRAGHSSLKAETARRQPALLATHKPSHSESWDSSKTHERVQKSLYSNALSFYHGAQNAAQRTITEFMAWADNFNPDDSETMEWWMHFLLDMGCTEQLTWQALHWALVLCQDESAFEMERDPRQSMWVDVVKKTPENWEAVIAQDRAPKAAPSKRRAPRRRKFVEEETAFHLRDLKGALRKVVDAKVRTCCSAGKVDLASGELRSEILACEVEKMMWDAQDDGLEDDQVDDLAYKCRIMLQGLPSSQLGRGAVAVGDILELLQLGGAVGITFDRLASPFGPSGR